MKEIARINKDQPAVTKENLTDKELCCIARHIQRYVKVGIHTEYDFPDPCECCTCSIECVERHFEFAWETMFKLGNITGVKISPMRGFKI